LIDNYFRDLAKTLKESRIVRAHEVDLDKREPESGYVRGNVYLADGSLLHFREFVNAERSVDRISYTYHYQKADGTFVFRYDDSEHFPGLPNFPHHKHIDAESNVIPAAPPDLEMVLHEIGMLIGVD
jgi:Family of unknown function (DUF6516)